MRLVNAKEMLSNAKKNKYAVGAFNINNLEWIKAILNACNEVNSPVILETSESAARYMGGYKAVFDLVNNIVKYNNINIDVCLHLDHGTYKGAIKALEAGYTSVMFDGSKYSIEDNIELTKDIVALAREKNASVEAEIGGIAGEEDGTLGSGEIANVNECVMICKTGIDMLAAGIGNIHGKYPSDWQGLNFDVLSKIHKRCNDIPLVLHGGSGIPTHMIKKAIELGVCKINVNTECQIAFAKGVRQYIEDGYDLVKKGYDPRKLLEPGMKAIENTVKDKIIIFGSSLKKDE